VGYIKNREDIYNITRQYIGGSEETKLGLHARIDKKFLSTESGQRFSQLSGLSFPSGNQGGSTDKECAELGFNSRNGKASFQVNNLWLASRATPEGKVVNHVVVTLTQTRGIICQLDNEQFKIKGYFLPTPQRPPGGMYFRGACTLIFDLDNLCLKYAIKKGITDTARMERQFRYEQESYAGNGTYFRTNDLSALSGPFAFMHTFPHQH
jgi:hypothetical protein